MATIYHRYQRGDFTYICPQKATISLNDVSPVVKRRLSESSERRLYEQHRRASIASEKASLMSSFQSLQDGKLPTNEQLNTIMNRLVYSSVFENNKKLLSIDGQLLLQDFQKLLMALQHALQAKNRDELFQSMIYHVRKSEASPNISSSTSNQAKKDIKNGAKAAYKISRLLLFNSKFRSLLIDIFSVAQQTLGTVLELTGKIIRENADTTTTASLGYNLKEEILSSKPTDKVEHQYSNPVILAPDIDITEGAGTSADIPVHQQIKLNSDDRNTNDKVNTIATLNTGSENNNQIKNELKQTMQDEESDNGKSAKEIITRLKEIFTTIQKNPEYRRAISTILSMVSIWNKKMNGTSEDRRDSMGIDNYATTAAEEAKAILEDWAQGKSLDPIIKKSYTLSSTIKEDPGMSQLQEKITRYIQRLLRDPGYLETEASTKDGSELLEEVKKSGYYKYKPMINSMLQESTDFVTAITDDATTKEISQRVKSIHKHLWYDSNGNATFKPQLLNDIRITLIPAIVEQIKYIPIPQIIYSDKEYEIAIKNLALSGDTLMPEMFEIKVDDHLKFSPKNKYDYTNSQSMHIAMGGIQTILEDVVFYFKRKTGFPRLSDAGVVSIHTEGSGININLRVTSNSKDQKHAFRVDQCHCRIDKLKIKVKSSKHKILYKVFNPMLTSIIKRQITKSIETKIISVFESGDKRITRHLDERRRSLLELQNQYKTVPLEETRRPGLFSHIVNVLNRKVNSI